MAHRSGFTLIELLVVVTIIVVLLALLALAMDRAIDAASKAACAAGLDTIGSSATMYALENKGEFFVSRGRNVQLTFTSAGDDNGYSNNYGRGASDMAVDWLKAMSTVGLASATPTTVPSGLTATVTTEPLHIPGKMWYCPSTDYEGFWDAGNRQYWVGYQWYGGILKWYDTANVQRPTGARSPVNMRRSKGGWVVAADRSVYIRDWATWGDNNAHPYFKGQANHKDDTGAFPDGNNQAYADGSVSWSRGEDLIMVHKYAGGINEMCFIEQKDIGFDPAGVDRARSYR
jgi:prepilin-type N-terminal cleavage/methylation domain-containing protein